MERTITSFGVHLPTRAHRCVHAALRLSKSQLLRFYRSFLSFVFVFNQFLTVLFFQSSIFQFGSVRFRSIRFYILDCFTIGGLSLLLLRKRSIACAASVDNYTRRSASPSHRLLSSLNQ